MFLYKVLIIRYVILFQQKNVNYFETKKPPVTNKRCIFAKCKLNKTFIGDAENLTE